MHTEAKLESFMFASLVRWESKWRWRRACLEKQGVVYDDISWYV